MQAYVPLYAEGILGGEADGGSAAARFPKSNPASAADGPEISVIFPARPDAGFRRLKAAKAMRLLAQRGVPPLLSPARQNGSFQCLFTRLVPRQRDFQNESRPATCVTSAAISALCSRGSAGRLFRITCCRTLPGADGVFSYPPCQSASSCKTDAVFLVTIVLSIQWSSTRSTKMLSISVSTVRVSPSSGTAPIRPKR